MRSERAKKEQERPVKSKRLSKSAAIVSLATAVQSLNSDTKGEARKHIWKVCQGEPRVDKKKLFKLMSNPNEQTALIDAFEARMSDGEFLDMVVSLLD